jgi:thioredoxin 1
MFVTKSLSKMINSIIMGNILQISSNIGGNIMSAIQITKDNFESEVLKSSVPVLVDFWAAWCGPCKMVGPIVDEVAKELEGKAKVGKINVDEEQHLAREFAIMSIPTLIVFKDGQVVNKIVGARSKAELIELLKA